MRDNCIWEGIVFYLELYGNRKFTVRRQKRDRKGKGLLVVQTGAMHALAVIMHAHRRNHVRI